MTDRIFNQFVSDLHLSEVAVTCSPETPIQRVAELMVMSSVGSVVILNGEKPAGIFTERDLVRCVADASIDLSAEPVKNRMTPNPRTIQSNAKLISVMAAMRMGKFRHLVVVRESGEIAGVISIRDVMIHFIDEFNGAK